jgi:hypothetical protein
MPELPLLDEKVHVTTVSKRLHKIDFVGSAKVISASVKVYATCNYGPSCRSGHFLDRSEMHGDWTCLNCMTNTSCRWLCFECDASICFRCEPIGKYETTPFVVLRELSSGDTVSLKCAVLSSDTCYYWYLSEIGWIRGDGSIEICLPVQAKNISVAKENQKQERTFLPPASRRELESITAESHHTENAQLRSQLKAQSAQIAARDRKIEALEGARREAGQSLDALRTKLSTLESRESLNAAQLAHYGSEIKRLRDKTKSAKAKLLEARYGEAEVKGLAAEDKKFVSKQIHELAAENFILKDQILSLNLYVETLVPLLHKLGLPENRELRMTQEEVRQVKDRLLVRISSLRLPRVALVLSAENLSSRDDEPNFTENGKLMTEKLREENRWLVSSHEYVTP